MRARRRDILAAVRTCIAANLQDPTHEMRVAFARLTTAHKTLLFALIDVDNNTPVTQKKDLLSLAEKLTPPNEDIECEQLLRELSEGFVRIREFKGRAKRTMAQVQWIHPSCRDLAIEELGRARQFRQKFLQFCSLAGIEVAISVGGGATGARSLPLLRIAEDWQQLVTRCVELVPQNPELLSGFLSTIQLLDDTTDTTKRGPLIDAAAATLHAYASSIKHWQPQTLKPFLELRRAIRVMQPVPSLRAFFDGECVSLTESLKDETSAITASASDLSTFAGFCKVLAQSAPDEAEFLLSSPPFNEFSAALGARVDDEAYCLYSRSDWTADALTSESESYMELAEALRVFGAIQVSGKQPLSAVADYAWRFESEAENLAVEAAKKDPSTSYEEPASDDAEQSTTPGPTAENLQRIFDDL